MVLELTAPEKTPTEQFWDTFNRMKEEPLKFCNFVLQKDNGQCYGDYR